MADESSDSVALRRRRSSSAAAATAPSTPASSSAPASGARAPTAGSWSWTATPAASSPGSSARRRRRELVVREWGDFFDQYLGGASPRSPAGATPSCPSPLMPHLMYDGWCAGRGPAGRSVGSSPAGAAAAGHAVRRACARRHALRLLRRLDSAPPTASSLPSVPSSGRRGRGKWRRPWRRSRNSWTGRVPTAGPVLFVVRASRLRGRDVRRGGGAGGRRGGGAAGRAPDPVDVLVGTVSSLSRGGQPAAPGLG